MIVFIAYPFVRINNLLPTNALADLFKGLSADRARGSIRFSLGKQNTAEDVQFALSLVPEVVTRLHEMLGGQMQLRRLRVRDRRAENGRLSGDRASGACCRGHRCA